MLLGSSAPLLSLCYATRSVRQLGVVINNVPSAKRKRVPECR